MGEGSTRIDQEHLLEHAQEGRDWRVDHRTLAQDLVRSARSAGADQAEVYLTQGRQIRLDVRLGQIEKIQHSGSTQLVLRVFRKGSMALGATSELKWESLEGLVDRTVSMTRHTESDPANGLPDPAAEVVPPASQALNLFDDHIAGLTHKQKLDRLLRMEQAGLDADPRVNNCLNAWWTDGGRRITLASSKGFVDHYDSSSAGYGVSLVAEADGVKQNDGWTSMARRLDGLESPESVGRKAAERTLRKLGSRSLESTRAPILFDPTVATDFLHLLLQLTEAGAIMRHNSFLEGQLGRRIGNPLLTVKDDPLLPAALGSRPFDAEGMPSRPLTVIDQGRLSAFLTDSYTARRLSLPNSGHASRGPEGPPRVGPSNFFLEPGSSPPEALISGLSRGLWVTKVYWVGSNLQTGDYSRGAEGFWIENGQVAFPVQEITIAGRMQEMLEGVEAVGNDLELRGAVAAPSMLLAPMIVSGR